MPTMTLTQEVYPFGELNFTIEYTYSPFTPGQYSGPPERCYPDEPEELDISSIKVEDCPFISPEVELIPYIEENSFDSMHAAVLDHVHDTIIDRDDVCDDYSPEDY